MTYIALSRSKKRSKYRGATAYYNAYTTRLPLRSGFEMYRNFVLGDACMEPVTIVFHSAAEARQLVGGRGKLKRRFEGLEVKVSADVAPGTMIWVPVQKQAEETEEAAPARGGSRVGRQYRHGPQHQKRRS